MSRDKRQVNPFLWRTEEFSTEPDPEAMHKQNRRRGPECQMAVDDKETTLRLIAAEIMHSTV